MDTSKENIYKVRNYIFLFYKAYERQQRRAVMDLGGCDGYGEIMEILDKDLKNAEEVKEILEHLVDKEFAEAG